MTAFPQLRVRTEFSFPRLAYGPVATVVDRLKALGAPAAAIVNVGGGCWGHARFEKNAVAAGIEPIFGAEFFVRTGEARPTAWVLGLSPSEVYRFCKGPETTPEAFAAARGLIRFAGAAMDDPECFDFVDISPSSPLAQRRALELSRRTGKRLALVGDNRCPGPEHVSLMHAMVDRSRDGLQWLENPEGMRHLFRGLTDGEFAAAVATSIEIGEQLRGQRIPKAPIIQLDGDLRALCREGMKSRLERGHIAEWTEEYESRLERELTLIAEKRFESYFLMVSDLVRWAKTKMLVGPARGSSAGSLVCYLIDITEVDPLVHKLLFERFIAPERNDLPDIDIDFSDVRRDIIFDYLAEKYGREHVARLGNVNTFKPNSVLTHVGKRLGIPIPETFAVKNVLFEYTSGDSRYGKGLEDTLTGTAPGIKFAEEHPQFLPLAAIEGHATHTGVHAAGVVVCNEPITNFCAVNEDGVAQVDKPDAEYLNLLKIDALGLRTLGILEDSGVVTPEQLYGLPLNDQAVLDVFNQKKMAGIFQFEGHAQRSVAAQVHFTSFQQLDHVTALARPGPLGGGGTNTYIRRHQGLEPVAFKHESMREYLSDALGVVLYQEQVLRIGREVGQLDWKELTSMRKAMSSRKGVEYFDSLGAKFKQGAANNGMKPEEAEELWQSIVTYGAWAMNMSHTVSYAIISYWCAWVKHYHPLEFAAATLRSAKSDEQVIDLLRELHSEGISYVAIDAEESEINWSVKDGRLVGGLMNAVGWGPAKATNFIRARTEGTLTEKQRDDLAAAKVKFADLFPLHTAYGHIYADPEAHGIRRGTIVKNIAELAEGEEAVVIVQLIAKVRRDANETILVKKRNGRRFSGNTLFLDMKVVDDSTSMPLTLRIDRGDWFAVGEKLADHAQDGKDQFLVRGRKLKGFPMISVDKIKCLNRPEITA